MANKKKANISSFEDYLEKEDEYKEKVFEAKDKKILTQDTDGDGLSDWEETNIYGTDPKNADTDGDGMSDGDEVKLGRNPLGKGMLKDLFIPHAGNDFHPHALHPKRIAFHAASVIAVKIIVVIFAMSFPLSAWLSPDLAMAQSQKIIKLTNDLRLSLKVPVLTENQKLDQAAYEKSQDMLLNQYFAHVNPEGRGLEYWLGKVRYNYAVAGENLAMGFATPEDVVTGWKNSPTHYANLVDKDFTEIGVGMSVGQFKGVETNLVAQYFGAPVEEQIKISVNKITKSKEVINVNKEAVLAIKKTQPATTALKNTKITVSTLPNKTEKTVEVVAYLAPQTKTAQVSVEDKQIQLNKDEKEPNKWTGTSLVVENNDNFQVQVMPALITTDVAGNTTAIDISNADIKANKINFLDQYLFFKSNPSPAMTHIFDFSSIYFKMLLFLALIIMLINIFVEIRKQHLRAILPGVGLIGLLIVLIIV